MKHIKKTQFLTTVLLSAILASCSSVEELIESVNDAIARVDETLTATPAVTVVSSVPSGTTTAVARPVVSGSGGSSLIPSPPVTNTDGATGISVGSATKPGAAAPTAVVDTSANPMGDTSAIMGLWDISSTEKDGETDFEYLKIGATGEVTLIDDQFDFDGDFQDCLISDSDSSFITSLGNDQYTITDVSLNGTTGAVQFEEVDVAMSVIDDKLNIFSNDDDNPDNVTRDQFPRVTLDIAAIAPCTDTSAIAGDWDASYTADGNTDTVYVRIDTEGVLTVFDDQQDTFDGGGNCFIIVTTRLTPAGDDTYDTAEGDTISIENNDSRTQLTLSGNRDDDEFWVAATIPELDECV
ncbi:MAG: hypothetical protein ACJAZF_001024 [Granulosicoccus sp.]|jgi:hypothetical protein